MRNALIPGIGNKTVTSFSVPPFAPAPVAEAYARYNDAGDAYGAKLGEIHDLKSERERARANAKRAAIDAAKGVGGAVVTVSTADIEREYAEKIQTATDELDVLDAAVHELGNEFAIAAATHRAEWLKALAAAETEAVARLAAALKEARSALVNLAPARGAVDWLTTFDHTQAIHGQQQQFPGGRIDVNTMSIRRESATRPEQLLDVLDEIVNPKTKAPKPATRRFAVESSR